MHGGKRYILRPYNSRPRYTHAPSYFSIFPPCVFVHRHSYRMDSKERRGRPGSFFDGKVFFRRGRFVFMCPEIREGCLANPVSKSYLPPRRRDASTRKGRQFRREEGETREIENYEPPRVTRVYAIIRYK